MILPLIIGLILNILWIWYSCNEGHRDGYMWKYLANKVNVPTNHYIHLLLFISRLICSTGIVVYYIMVEPLWYLVIGEMAFICLIFPFFHNGTYYNTRNLLDPGTYPKGFKDQSTTSVAYTTKYTTWKARLIMFILGMVIQVITIGLWLMKIMS